jgi:hypothetical protein
VVVTVLKRILWTILNYIKEGRRKKEEGRRKRGKRGRSGRSGRRGKRGRRGRRGKRGKRGKKEEGMNHKGTEAQRKKEDS